MIWYLQWQCCHLILSNHTGHPWLVEYSSDSLISISVILRFEQSHLASPSTCLESSSRSRGKFPPWQLTRVFYWGNFSFRLYFFSPFFYILPLCFHCSFSPHSGRHQRLHCIYLSSHLHLKVPHELHRDKQMVLTLLGCKCTRMHVHKCLRIMWYSLHLWFIICTF